MSVLADLIPPGWIVLGAFIVGYVLGGWVMHHMDLWAHRKRGPRD